MSDWRRTFTMMLRVQKQSTLFKLAAEFRRWPIVIALAAAATAVQLYFTDLTGRGF
jgi:hypothetical protein